MNFDRTSVMGSSTPSVVRTLMSFLSAMLLTCFTSSVRYSGFVKPMSWRKYCVKRCPGLGILGSLVNIPRKARAMFMS